MSNQKLITITEDQLDAVTNGALKDFVLDMLKIGASLAQKGLEPASVRGPYDSDDNGLLLIVNLREIEPNNQAARS